MNEVTIPGIECSYTNASLKISNYELVENAIKEFAKKYECLEISDESEITLAKRDLADLRKMQKSIDDERKSIKKEILAQFAVGEEQYVKLATLLNGAINNIDSQLKSYDAQQKQNKLEEIKTLFKEINNNDSILLEKIMEDKWLNKSCSIATIKNEIIVKLNKINDDISILEQVITSNENDLYLAKFEYMKNLDLQSVISNYKEKQKLLDTQEVKKIVDKKIEKQEKRVYQIAFAIEATAMQIEQLDLYLKGNKIKYKQIKDKELIKNVWEEK